MARLKTIEGMLLNLARREMIPVSPEDIHFGICAAIDAASTKWRTRDPVFTPEQIVATEKAVKARIARLIGQRSMWLTGWLVEHGHTHREELFTTEGMQRLRQTRLNWIDDLIRYYEGAK